MTEANRFPLKLLLITKDTKEEGLPLLLGQADPTTFHIQTADNLSTALQYLEATRFDIILQDLAVQAGGRTDAFSRIHSCVPDTPIVVASDLDDTNLALKSLLAGAQEFLVKKRMNPAALERVLVYAVQRYSVEEALARERHLSNTLINSIPDLIYIKDPDGRFLQMNRAQAQALGLSNPEDAVGTTDFEYFEPAVAQKAMDEELQIMRTGHPILDRIEKSVNSNGRQCWYLTTKMPLYDAKNRIIGTFGILRNVTELKHSEEDRRLMLESMIEGVYGVDTHGRITFMNKSAAAMFRCEASQVLGKKGHSLFHHTRGDGTPYPPSECPIADVFRSGKGREIYEELMWRMDGTHFIAKYSAYPVKEDGSLAGAVVSIEDITDRKQMEVELRHAQKLKAVGGLAAGIAHEINTPIQFVGDNAQFVLDSFNQLQKLLDGYQSLYAAAQAAGICPGLLGDIRRAEHDLDLQYVRKEVPKALEQTIEGLERVSTIVRAMKEFSHVGRSTTQCPADINKALASTLVVARNEIKYVADVETDFEELPLVVCQIEDLNQVFLNLLVNAAHAIRDAVGETDRRGVIRVTTRQLDDWVEIAIADDGAGIPEAARQHIFEPFFTTKDIGEGTGQGLALARAIVVEKHGGKITFASKIRKGTTFYVRLPIGGVPMAEEVAS